MSPSISIYPMLLLRSLSAALVFSAAALANVSAQAQAPGFTSHQQFNDTLVAQFNRGDFTASEAYSSAALRQLESAGSMRNFLAKLKAQTGQITAIVPLRDQGKQHEFEWRGEKQNLRVTLVAATPGVLDDYIISDFIAQPTARTTPALTDNQQKSVLDQAVHRAATLYMQHPDAAGLSIGIYQGGKMAFYNYGEVEKGAGRLPTSSTYYDLGSVAKTVVGTLLAQAVLDKKLKLTDDIRQYLPGQYANLAFEGQPIQVLHLANHTSGMPGVAQVYSPARKEWQGNMSLVERTAYYNQYTADSLLQDMHRFQLETKPGTTYRYNGVAMLVLQLVLERVYQQPYEQLVTKYVRTRFGMPDTKRVLSATEHPRFATGYDKRRQPQQHPNYTGYWGGPNMSSTAADLLKYAAANLKEREPAVRLAHQRTYGADTGFGMGLGWMLDTDSEGQRRIYHDGQSIGFNTRCVLYPAQDVAVVLLVNENISQSRLTQLEQCLKRELPSVARATRPTPGQ
ncbi:serine hydrolase domain-containing protein [Hymenobacter endophyticus]|uniref:Serine hydrolase domain-containing protein n=1 Tax=Hymenobacter endophyticus TaxID=3076335 RepID=A0ABU3TCG9_9BACT|nr:serine hydrolase domain-containing protein [Hymenobacter endophyticus]MDU0369062.1 serine hydrolase domain-containing protein [Hymenobacter endophyticus]